MADTEYLVYSTSITSSTLGSQHDNIHVYIYCVFYIWCAENVLDTHHTLPEVPAYTRDQKCFHFPMCALWARASLSWLSNARIVNAPNNNNNNNLYILQVVYRNIQPIYRMQYGWWRRECRASHSARRHNAHHRVWCLYSYRVYTVVWLFSFWLQANTYTIVVFVVFIASIITYIADNKFVSSWFSTHIERAICSDTCCESDVQRLLGGSCDKHLDKTILSEKIMNIRK